jgi:hypothetical protein
MTVAFSRKEEHHAYAIFLARPVLFRGGRSARSSLCAGLHLVV